MEVVISLELMNEESNQMSPMLVPGSIFFFVPCEYVITPIPYDPTAVQTNHSWMHGPLIHYSLTEGLFLCHPVAILTDALKACRSA